MKYELGDKVATTRVVMDLKRELKIIDKDIEGVIVVVDGTAKTCQPYLVEFEKTIIEGCGRRWWVFEEEITRC